MPAAVYQDLAELPENGRIKVIGERAMEAGTSADKPPLVGFVVESEAIAKRYITKLKRRFPRVRVIDQTAGFVAGTVLVRVAGPLR